MRKHELLMLAIALLLISCSNEEQEQKQWIYDNLPTKVWQDVTYERLDAEYKRLSSSLINLANNAKDLYYTNAVE